MFAPAPGNPVSFCETACSWTRVRQGIWAICIYNCALVLWPDTKCMSAFWRRSVRADPSLRVLSQRGRSVRALAEQGLGFGVDGARGIAFRHAIVVAFVSAF